MMLKKTILILSDENNDTFVDSATYDKLQRIAQMFNHLLAIRQRTASRMPSDPGMQAIANEAIPQLQTETSMPPVSEYPVISIATSKTMIVTNHTMPLPPAVSHHVYLSLEEIRTRRVATRGLKIELKNFTIIHASVTSSENTSEKKTLIPDGLSMEEGQRILQAVKMKCVAVEINGLVVYVENDKVLAVVEDVVTILLGKVSKEPMLDKMMQLLTMRARLGATTLYFIDCDRIFSRIRAFANCWNNECSEIFIPANTMANVYHLFAHEGGHAAFRLGSITNYQLLWYQEYAMLIQQAIQADYQHYRGKRHSLAHPYNNFAHILFYRALSKNYMLAERPSERFAYFMEILSIDPKFVSQIAPHTYALFQYYVGREFTVTAMQLSAQLEQAERLSAIERRIHLAQASMNFSSKEIVVLSTGNKQNYRALFHSLVSITRQELTLLASREIVALEQRYQGGYTVENNAPKPQSNPSSHLQGIHLRTSYLGRRTIEKPVSVQPVLSSLGGTQVRTPQLISSAHPLIRNAPIPKIWPLTSTVANNANTYYWRINWPRTIGNLSRTFGGPIIGAGMLFWSYKSNLKYEESYHPQYSNYTHKVVARFKTLTNLIPVIALSRVLGEHAVIVRSFDLERARLDREYFENILDYMGSCGLPAKQAKSLLDDFDKQGKQVGEYINNLKVTQYFLKPFEAFHQSDANVTDKVRTVGNILSNPLASKKWNATFRIEPATKYSKGKIHYNAIGSGHNILEQSSANTDPSFALMQVALGLEQLNRAVQLGNEDMIRDAAIQLMKDVPPSAREDFWESIKEIIYAVNQVESCSSEVNAAATQDNQWEPSNSDFTRQEIVNLEGESSYGEEQTGEEQNSEDSLIIYDSEHASNISTISYDPEPFVASYQYPNVNINLDDKGRWIDNVKIDNFDESIGVTVPTKWGDVGTYISSGLAMILIKNPNPWVAVAAVVIITTALLVQNNHYKQISKKLKASIKHSNADTEITFKLYSGLQKMLKKNASPEDVLKYIDEKIIPNLNKTIENERRRAADAKACKNKEARKAHESCKSEYKAIYLKIISLKDELQEQLFAKQHEADSSEQLIALIHEIKSSAPTAIRVNTIQKLIINKAFQLWMDGKNKEARTLFESESNNLFGLTHEELFFYFKHQDETPEFWLKHWDQKGTSCQTDTDNPTENWYEHLMSSMILNSIQKDITQNQFDHAMHSLFSLMSRKPGFHSSKYAVSIIAACFLEGEPEQAEILYKQYLERVGTAENQLGEFQANTSQLNNSTNNQLVEQLEKAIAKPEKTLGEEIGVEVASTHLVIQIVNLMLAGKGNEAKELMARLQQAIDNAEHGIQDNINQTIVLNMASALANNGFNRQAGRILRHWQALLPNNNEKLQDKADDLDFAGEGQLVRVILPEVLRSFRLHVSGYKPAPWKKSVLFVLQALGVLQEMLPQALSFGVQAYLLPNPTAVVERGRIQLYQQLATLNPFDRRFNPFNRNTTDPSTYYQGMLTYAKMSLHALPFLPFKNTKQLLKMGQHVLQLTSAALTAWQLKNALSKEAQNKPIAAMPLLAAGLVATVVDWYEKYQESPGEFSENPNDYLTWQAATSVVNFAGNTAYVGRIMGGLVNPVAGITTLLLGATSVYNSLCEAAKQERALKSMKAARGNIKHYHELLAPYRWAWEIGEDGFCAFSFCSSIDKRARDEAEHFVPLLTKKLVESQKNMTTILNQQFNGLAYNPSQPQQINKARAVLLHERVKAHYNKNECEEVIKWSALITKSSAKVTAEYHLPAHLIWEMIVTFRFSAYLRLKKLRLSFREEYQRCVQAIHYWSDQDKSWYKKNWEKIETKLNQTVKMALERFYWEAKVTKSSEEQELYLLQITSPYHFCKPWYEQLTGEEKNWIDNQLLRYGYDNRVSTALQNERVESKTLQALTIYQSSKRAKLSEALMGLLQEERRSKTYWWLLYDILNECIASSKYTLKGGDPLLWGFANICAKQLDGFPILDDSRSKINTFIDCTNKVLSPEIIYEAGDYLLGERQAELRSKLERILFSLFFTYNDEYYFPMDVPADGDCAFYVHGIRREEGIKKLIDHVKDCQHYDEVMIFILKEMQFWKKFTYKENLENLDKNKEVVCAYLLKFAKARVWMRHNPNPNPDENYKGYSILDALAFVQKKNFKVYVTNAQGELVLSSQNVFDEKFETIITLLTSKEGFCDNDNGLRIDHFIKLVVVPKDKPLRPEARTEVPLNKRQVSSAPANNRGRFFTAKTEDRDPDRNRVPASSHWTPPESLGVCPWDF